MSFFNRHIQTVPLPGFVKIGHLQDFVLQLSLASAQERVALAKAAMELESRCRVDHLDQADGGWLARGSDFMETLERAREQITGVVSGQVVSMTDTPLLTSASTSWSGFLLEVQAAHVVRQDVWWGWNRTHVNLVTKGTLGFRVRRTGRAEEFVARAGSALVFPSGFDETRFSVAKSDFQLICVELDPVRVEKFLRRKGPAAVGALAPQMVVKDEQIAGLLTRMQAEVAEGCPSGNLYGQSLSMALASYLEGRFSVKRPERKPLPQLSKAQARQVIDYIHANLDCHLNLLDLANLVQFSSRQFFRIFSNTFGTTPHQYVMNKRVALAKELLSSGQLLIEIAAVVGFASQSHFNGVFRKATGMSPGRFRREQRS